MVPETRLGDSANRSESKLDEKVDRQQRAVIKAALWDIDGTLVDSEQVRHRALLDALQLWNVEPPPELQQELIGVEMARTYALLVNRFASLPRYREFVLAKFRADVARSAELTLRAGAAEAMDLLRAEGVQRRRRDMCWNWLTRLQAA